MTAVSIIIVSFNARAEGFCKEGGERRAPRWTVGEGAGVEPTKNAAEQASSGNDAMVGGGAEAGILYGANDDRRPAGAAIGY